MTAAGIGSEQLPERIQGRDDREQVGLMWLASCVGIRPVVGKKPSTPTTVADGEDALCSSEVGRRLAGAFGWGPPPSHPNSNAEHGGGLVLMRALMDRVGFRLVPGAGSVVSLESASPTPTPNAPTRRRSSSRPAPTVALVWWAGDEHRGELPRRRALHRPAPGTAGLGHGPPASAGLEFTPSGQSGTIALGSEAAECGAAIRKLR